VGSYIKVRLFSVPASLEEDVTDHCFESGATGVTEVLAFSQPDLTYDPSILPVKTHDLDVYFTETPNDTFFDGLKVLAPSMKWQTLEEQDKDWLEEWKKGFVPFKLIGNYWVVPSWHEKPAEADVGILIDPGMAFGTGTHATTKMAAYFVQKLSSQFKDLTDKSLLDVGTGTAILAMLASHEGVKRILGLEIDPEARRVARENIVLNKLTNIEISDKPLEETGEKFDFVVANIIDGVLIQLKDALLRTLKPGGHIFLTGILTERDNHFFTNFIEKSNLKVVRRIEKDEWVGYWLQNNA